MSTRFIIAMKKVQVNKSFILDAKMEPTAISQYGLQIGIFEYPVFEAVWNVKTNFQQKSNLIMKDRNKFLRAKIENVWLFEK